MTTGIFTSAAGEPGDRIDVADVLAWVFADDPTVSDEQALAEARDIAVEVRLDDETFPEPQHTLSCAVWVSNDPCDCFDGVEQLVNLFESYAPQRQDDVREAAI